MITQEYQATYIATNTTTVVSTGRTLLHTVVCPIALTGTATFQDSAATAYFVLPINSIGTLQFDCALDKGLSVVTSAADKLIINWQK